MSVKGRSLIAALLIALAAPPFVAGAQPPFGPPRHATRFLDHGVLLNEAGLTDHSWYEANIPFFEAPDAQIQDVYYYRWFTWREHLNYLSAATGYTSSEFLPQVPFTAPGGAIDAAAGHVIHDGRWVRDQSYLDDYLNFWMTGPGASQAHDYTFWAASSYYARYLVNGDAESLRNYQPALIAQWHGWDSNFNRRLGLYWIQPQADAMEYDAASYESGHPFGGGYGYRSSINAYQWADAMAISKIATMNGDATTAREFVDRAAALKANMQRWLWDSRREFFYHMQRDHNRRHALLDTREEYGFFPWYFEMPAASDSMAWKQLVEPQGFAATFGPTTTERRSRWFMHQAYRGPGSYNCCRWDGPSWPYATSLTLEGLANLLDDYPRQPYVNAADYVRLLHDFAATQYKSGVPYVAEAHHPDRPVWIYDKPGYSLDYNHSSYTDQVISGLVGIRPQPGRTVKIQPLTPSSWSYWALENVPYHGHNLTVIYDRDGHRYHQGRGLRVYVDGRQVADELSTAPITVEVGATISPAASTWLNVAANPGRAASGPHPFASYASRSSDPWRAVDGRNSWHPVPNTHWSSAGSPHALDWFGVNLGREVRANDVRVYLYDDGRRVLTPARYELQYEANGGWVDIPSQRHSPTRPVGNAVNEIAFPAIRARRWRILAPKPSPQTSWGVAEFEVWVLEPSPNGGDGDSYRALGVRGHHEAHRARDVDVRR